MKLSKQYIIEQLKTKTPEELATEIIKAQAGDVPADSIVDVDKTFSKYVNRHLQGPI